MSKCKSKHRSVVAAAASIAALMVAVESARASSGSPELNVQILGSLSGNAGTFVPDLSPVASGTTIFFEIAAQSAAPGTVNTQGSQVFTANGVADELSNLPFLNITQSGNGTFQNLTVLNSFNLAGGTGTNNGTSVTGIRLAHSGPFSDVAGAALLSGQFVVGSSNASITAVDQFVTDPNPSDYTSGAITVGGKAAFVTFAAETSAAPLLAFPSLTFTALTWSGGAGNGNWNVSTDANFSGSNYTDGSAVIFGDKAANGTTAVQNTAPITIAAGGAAPASVNFINGTTAYTLQNASGTTGIKGSTGVMLSGGANVTFSSPNTYSGGTTIAAGTLFANANSATGSNYVAVGAGSSNYGGGRLSGSGTVAGNVSLAASSNPTQGGIITAGATSSTIGTLTTGNEFWGGGAAYQWKIGSSVGTFSGGINGTPGSSYDELVIGSSGSPLTLTANGFAPFTIAPKGALTNVTSATTYNWVIAQIGSGIATTITLDLPPSDNQLGTGPIPPNPAVNLLTLQNFGQTNEFALDTSGLTANAGQFGVAASQFSLFFETVGSNNDLVLQYTSTPEPATTLMVLGAAAPMLLARRRRNRATAQTTA